MMVFKSMLPVFLLCCVATNAKQQTLNANLRRSYLSESQEHALKADLLDVLSRFQNVRQREVATAEDIKFWGGAWNMLKGAAKKYGPSLIQKAADWAKNLSFFTGGSTPKPGSPKTTPKKKGAATMKFKAVLSESQENELKADLLDVLSRFQNVRQREVATAEDIKFWGGAWNLLKGAAKKYG